MLSDDFSVGGDVEYAWQHEPLASMFLGEGASAPSSPQLSPRLDARGPVAAAAINDEPGGASPKEPDLASIVSATAAAPIPLPATSHALRLSGVTAKALRVENQVKLGLAITRISGPARVWRTVLLPAELCALPMSARHWPDTHSALQLTASVFCSSDPSHREIQCCMACLKRETRSLERKRVKAAVTRGAPASTDDASAVDDSPSAAQTSTSALVFCCEPARPIKDGQLVVPFRLRCYCSHHDEKSGFSVWLKLHDRVTGEIVATAVTDPIMVRDDHKTGDRRKTAKRQRVDGDDSLLASPTDENDEAVSSTFTPDPVPVPQGAPQQQTQQAQVVQPPQQTGPRLFKIAPAQGPIMGGVTIMAAGCDLYQGHRLHFGPYIATDTQAWGNGGTLMCTLPPAAAECTVPVTVDGRPMPGAPVFTYKDDGDMKLFALALQLVGMKLTGRIDSPKQVALNIVQSTRTSSVTQQQPSGGGSSQNSTLSVESLLLRSLSVAWRARTGFDMPLRHQDLEAERTILHFAAARGYASLSAWLARQGGPALMDEVDAAGFTALHYAAFYGHQQIVELLLSIGASAFVCTDDGRFPADMASTPRLRALLTKSAPSSCSSHSPDYASALMPPPCLMSALSTPPAMYPVRVPVAAAAASATAVAASSASAEPQDSVDAFSPELQERRQRLPSDSVVVTISPWGNMCTGSTTASWWARNAVLVIGLVMVSIVVLIGCLTSPNLLQQQNTEVESNQSKPILPSVQRGASFVLLRVGALMFIGAASLSCLFVYLRGHRTRQLLTVSVLFLSICCLEVLRFFL